MRVLNPQTDLSKFFHTVKTSKSRALLLDYDGTLAPFRVGRDKAVPYPGVAEALKRIMQNNTTRLVLISGRRLHGLVALLGLEPLPEIWGSHGGERLFPDGTYQKATMDNNSSLAMEAAADWMQAMGWSDHVERKPLSLALHWRGIEPYKMEQMQAKTLEHVPPMVEGTELCLHEFDGGLELRLRGITKAEAVKAILAEAPQGEPVAAYLGDDYTDEDAFAALKGRGLGVLVRQQLRETVADLWLRPPDELLEFLGRWEVDSGSRLAKARKS